ncbi:head GIN domain-containing protein [Costertonia aggregata]|uniref:DUF2807 domain-containing protein n=1 Tax=Costertonia aggregata TaxID=343403 RepID=A0A7H9ASM3_9FLAO|nr:head GIN domain-containing protein [Costertonia aggregata]QLG46454.1 DUF2807 domain-containing protein [Costertonia aggregata]
MKKSTSLALILLFTLSATAQWGKRIKGNGNMKTIERSIGDYESISLSGWFDVDLVSGNEGEITLRGEENLLEYIKTEVKNGKLVIKTEKGVNLKPSNWKSGIKVTVPVESIEGIAISGSGDIVGKTIIRSERLKTSMSGSGNLTMDVETDYLSVSMSGSGDMDFAGSTKDFDVSISGSGDVEAYGLEADNVTASVSGSADIQVTVNKVLKARVSGSGDISYRGNPEKIDTKTSGSGDISKG